MADDLGALVVRVGGDSSELQSAMRKAKNAVSDFAGSARDAIPSIAAIGVASATAAAVGIAALISKTMDAVGAQADLAARLGTTSASIATLSHAAMLSGVELSKVESSSEFLARQLSKASESGSAAADTFARLKLSAGELQAMPLDQRIATINQALIDNVAASDRAAVAAEIYGAKAGSAMRALSPEAIAEAAAQVEKLGLNISEIDAEKIAAAGDAVGAASKVFDGMMQQMTAELAPTITAIANQFFDTTTSIEGFGTAGKTAAEGILAPIMLVADAVAGVGRTFNAVAFSIDAALARAGEDVVRFAAAITEGPINTINSLIYAINLISGSEIKTLTLSDDLAKSLAEAEQATIAANQKIHDTLMEPMPSDQFKQYVANAKAAAEEAGAASVKMRESLQGEGSGEDSGPASSKKSDDLKAKLEAVRVANASEIQLLTEKQTTENEILRQSLEARMMTREQYAAQQAANDARHAEETMALLSQPDPRNAEIQKRLEVLQAANDTEIAMTADKQAQIAAIMQSGGQEEGAESGELGNVEARLAKIAEANASELEMLRTKHAEEMALITEADAVKAMSAEERRALELETAARHQDELKSVEERAADARIKVAKAEGDAKKAALGTALGDLSTLMNSGSRKMFEVGKAAAISQTVLSTYEGAQKAYSSLAGIPVVGPALGIAAAGAAIAAGVARVQSIRSQQFGGGASTPTGSNTGQVNAGSQPVGASGGGGGGGSAGSGTMYIQGLNKNDLYSGDQLIDVINEAQRNGKRLVMI